MLLACPAIVRSEHPRLIAASAKLTIEPLPTVIAPNAGVLSVTASAAMQGSKMRIGLSSVRPNEHLYASIGLIEILQGLADYRTHSRKFRCAHGAASDCGGDQQIADVDRPIRIRDFDWNAPGERERGTIHGFVRAGFIVKRYAWRGRDHASNAHRIRLSNKAKTVGAVGIDFDYI